MTKTFRPAKWVKYLGMVFATIFLAALVANSSVFFLEEPAKHGFKGEHSVAIVGGMGLVVYGTMLAMSLYLWAAFYIERFTIQGTKLSVRSMFQNRQFEASDVVCLQWRVQPAGGSLVFHVLGKKARVGFYGFSNDDRLSIIQAVHDLAPAQVQEGWAQFWQKVASPLRDGSFEAEGFAMSKVRDVYQAQSRYIKLSSYILGAAAFVVAMECVAAFLLRDTIKNLIEETLGKEFAFDWPRLIAFPMVLPVVLVAFASLWWIGRRRKADVRCQCPHCRKLLITYLLGATGNCARCGREVISEWKSDPYKPLCNEPPKVCEDASSTAAQQLKVRVATIPEFNDAMSTYFRRMWWLISLTLAGFLCLCIGGRLHLGPLGSRTPNTETAEIALWCFLLVFFCGGLWLVYRSARKNTKLNCLYCRKFLIGGQLSIIATRNCCHCGTRILEVPAL